MIAIQKSLQALISILINEHFHKSKIFDSWARGPFEVRTQLPSVPWIRTHDLLASVIFLDLCFQIFFAGFFFPTFLSNLVDEKQLQNFYHLTINN